MNAVNPVEAFRERCEAKAYLVRVGYLELADAVDELHLAAERDGLVAEYGQDLIQKIMSAAFNMERRP
jgi:hypothetical protein